MEEKVTVRQLAEALYQEILHGHGDAEIVVQDCGLDERKYVVKLEGVTITEYVESHCTVVKGGSLRSADPVVFISIADL